MLSLENPGETHLLVQKGGESRLLSFDEIVFCEVIDRKVYLHRRLSQVLDYYDRLERLEAKLDDSRSCRNCSYGKDSFRLRDFFYLFLLTAEGVFLCGAKVSASLLYAVFMVEFMRFSHGIFNSLLSMLYLWVSAFCPRIFFLYPERAAILWMIWAIGLFRLPLVSTVFFINIFLLGRGTRQALCF